MNITYCDICLKPQIAENTLLYVATGGSTWGFDLGNSFVVCRQCVVNIRATAAAREKSIRSATEGGPNV